MGKIVVRSASGAAFAVARRRVALRAVVALAIMLAGTLAWVAAGGGAQAGAANTTKNPAPLDTIAAPVPDNEAAYIRDKPAAVKLGKALFWDMQAGSDGRTACATCHFDAGADNRSRNEINPRTATTPSFTMKGPNAQLDASDFPFHHLADPNNAASAVVSDTTNVAGSQGVLPSTFDGVTPGEPVDDQTFATSDSDFKDSAGTPVRRSTGRNTPSVINAVFNFRNFWDGRAQNVFNGVSPFGTRDTGATVGQVNASGGVDQVHVAIGNASLASQAVGPPGNPVEMSSNGRTLSDIGHKLLSLQPLHAQIVSPTDSVLGGNVGPIGRGLDIGYGDMIKQAFQPNWWNSDARVTAGNGRDYSLMEYNFSLFWGLAIDAYESTLVSDRSPLDTGTMSVAAQQGESAFIAAGCTECHMGPALTSASTFNIGAPEAGAVLGTETDKAARLTDTGFANIGVRDTSEDPGVGGSDPFGNPLSISKLSNPVAPPGGFAVNGAFKVPGLRNVALTAPYFHNGGQLTLRQVVDFYSRGGDFTNGGTGAGGQKDFNMIPLGLTDQQKDLIVTFLEALTDPRVENQSAPFDHPELFVPAGEQTDASGKVLVAANGRAVDCFQQVPATGAAGGAPLPRFPATTGPCVDAPDLHNPPAVPRPAAAPGIVPATAAAAATPTKPVAAVKKTVSCVVPRLRGKTLSQARGLLSRAHCRLGSVIRVASHGRTLVVRSQSPSAGAKRKSGTRVAVRLQPKPKAKARSRSKAKR